jgi:ZU5 domain
MRWLVPIVVLVSWGCGGPNGALIDAPVADGGVGDANASKVDATAGPDAGITGVTFTVTPAGGTFDGPLGLRISFPAGAVAAELQITIDAETGLVPDGRAARSPVYHLQPEGLTFAQPVTLTIPFTGDSTNLVMFWTRLGSATRYDELLGSIAGGTLSAANSHFSHVGLAVGNCVGGTVAPRTITSDATWAASAGPYHVPEPLGGNAGTTVTNGAVLTIEADTHVCFGSGAALVAAGGGRLVVGDLLGSPATFQGDIGVGTSGGWDGITVQDLAASPSQIVNVTIDTPNQGIETDTNGLHVVNVTNAVIINSQHHPLRLFSAGSTFVDSTIDGTQTAEENGAINLGNASTAHDVAHPIAFSGRVTGAKSVAIQVGSPYVRLTSCSVDTNGTGILIRAASADGPTIDNCSILGNAGYAIDNEVTPATIVAEHDWWGPAGPQPSMFIGTGQVDFMNPLSSAPTQTFP